MSRREWRCRNPACPEPHGAVLGRITGDGGLVLDGGVMRFAVYVDTTRIAVWCPRCGQPRDFAGRMLFSPRTWTD